MKNTIRLESLDALRGFDMFWIIGGDWIFGSLHDIFQSPATEFIQTQLSHVRWEGFRFWDLIMPLFLFIVGTAMPFSFSKRLDGGDSKKKLHIHVLKRFVILFILGMIAQGHLLEYDLSTLHIFSNTLQAIAAGYLIAALIMLNLRVKWQIMITPAMLLLFWGLLAWVPVSGFGTGVLTPEGNLAISIDKWILGSFQDGTTYSWILSSLTFACTVLLGVFSGYILRSDSPQKKKLVRLFVFGILCLGFGLLWSLVFPIIKHIWTSSFVLFSGGISILLLALFYLVIDIWGRKKWAFVFKVIGMNAIAVYMVTRIFDFRLMGNVFVGGLAERLGTWSNLVEGLGGFAVIWLILYFVYTKKIFIKI
ncbi:acyltransferase family protein [Acidobacteriota bacterium]